LPLSCAVDATTVVETMKGQRISGMDYTERSVPLDLLNMARYYELDQPPVESTCCLLLPSFCALHTVLLTPQFAEGHE